MYRKASDRKKWILLVGMVVLLVVFFLPIPVSQTADVTVRAPYEKTMEQVSSLQRWRSWWPDTGGIHVTGDSVFYTPAIMFRVRNRQSLQLVLAQQNGSAYHVITVMPVGNDTTCIIQWKKISYLHTAVSDKIGLLFGSRPYAPAHLLERVKESMEDPVKYYGFRIRVEPVEDSFVLVKHGYATTATLPGRIREMYASLQQYLDSLHYTGRTDKMFHVDSLGGDSVQVMTGLSLAKQVEAKPPLRMMTMPRAHIVTGDYEGDYKNISRIHQAVTNYMKDHNIMPVAVVYEKMLSDPRTARDSLHVRVKVYHPPMIP